MTLVAIGRLMTPLARRRLNPVELTLQPTGMTYLAKHVTHMLRPNYPSLNAYNRHYVYTRGSGWRGDIVTLSRPSVKYDVINGVLTEIPADALGANGRVEPERTNIATHSANLSTEWVRDIGSLVYTDHTTYATIDVTAGLDYYSLSSINEDIGGRSFSFSCDLKGIAGQIVNICVDYGGAPAAYGKEVSVTLTGSWQRVSASFTFPAVGVQTLYARVGSRVLHDGSATTATVFDVRNAQLEEGAYATTYIPNVTGTSTRSADAWDMVNDGLYSLSEGSWLAIVNLEFLNERGWILSNDNDQHSLEWNDEVRKFNFTIHDGGYRTVNSDVVSSTGIAAVACRWKLPEDAGLGSGIICNAGTIENYFDALLASSAVSTRLDIGRYNRSGIYFARPILLTMGFDRKLTDAEMQALTSTAFRSAVAGGL